MKKFNGFAAAFLEALWRKGDQINENLKNIENFFGDEGGFFPPGAAVADGRKKNRLVMKYFFLVR